MNRSVLSGLLVLSLLILAGCSGVIETFVAALTGGAEVPPVTTSGMGSATLMIEGQTGRWTLGAANLTSNVTAAHIHGPAAVDQNAGILVTLSGPQANTSISLSGTFTPADVSGMTWDTFVTHARNGMLYVNVHTTTNPGGEVRGQLATQEPRP